jgi:23S rRNA (cytosine1962-C5)-methyltransferase
MIPFGGRRNYLDAPTSLFFWPTTIFMTPPSSGAEPTVPVLLRKPLEGRLKAGHPWVFRDALRDPPALGDGTIVLVRGRDKRPLARGYWDARSPIAVRVVTTEAGAALGELVQRRVAETLQERTERLRGTQTTAFRWIHGEADRLPGIHVDVYDDVAAVRFDGDGARAFYRDLPALLLATAAAAGQPVRTVMDRQTRRILAGPPAGQRQVLENGLRFLVDLEHGQKGGLFLDQRENRAEVRRRAQGKRVLNLFGYTGGFSVYAAAGGARATDTVDLAAPAIEAARQNFALNQLDLGQAGFHAEDAFAFLTRARAAGTKWDIVISDPPSFAPRQSALPAARTAYRRLHALGAAVTAPGGLFCPASCSSHFPRDEFLASVQDGARQTGQEFLLETLTGAGFDHPVRDFFPEGDYLKFAIGRLRPLGRG